MTEQCQHLLCLKNALPNERFCASHSVNEQSKLTQAGRLRADAKEADRLSRRNESIDLLNGVLPPRPTLEDLREENREAEHPTYGTIAEADHARRARNLLVAFGDEEHLAEFLHQGYRAAAKAMAKAHGKAWRRHDGTYVYKDGPLLHDHGWGDCYGDKRRYFLRRAAWLLSPKPHQNGRVPR